MFLIILFKQLDCKQHRKRIQDKSLQFFHVTLKYETFFFGVYVLFTFKLMRPFLLWCILIVSCHSKCG